MPQGEERPEQRELDLFSTAPVDHCQFKSLVFTFIADHLTATLPWLCAGWITSSWRYPVAADMNILTNTGFFRKKTHFTLLKDGQQYAKKSTTCFTVAFFFPLVYTKVLKAEQWPEPSIWPHTCPHQHWYREPFCSIFCKVCLNHLSMSKTLK